MSRAQREYDLREPVEDIPRSERRERIEALVEALNEEVEALCDLDEVPCDRVTVQEVMELATGLCVRWARM